jgi:2-dehydro-3-deoxygluconokinase
MNKSHLIYKQLKKSRLIALLTPESADQCVIAYEVLNPLGITLEIAFRSESALAGIKAVTHKYPDALLLAGTVMTPRQAEEVTKAGVAGVVSADYIPSVVETCLKQEVMCIPGGLSDAGKQLVQKAELYNCSLEELKVKYPYQWIYKLFPAIAGNKSNVEIAAAWRGPLKDLTIVYTGGISAENLPDLVFKDPGGIFCGSALTKHVEQPDRMREEGERWINIVQQQSKKETGSTKSLKPKSTMKSKVVTFGEIMLRLSPPDHLRFIQTRIYDATYGGAEANAAVAFANYGLHSTFLSALPDNEIGQGALNMLRSFGVNTQYILTQGRRIGIYFLEYGASQRPSKVIYDRAGSSISEIKPGEFNWEDIFNGATWFHWSGITPALSDNAAEVVLEALKAARKAGTTISVDLNYRKKLWSPEKAGRIMTELMKHVDVCIGNEEDAEMFFNIKAGSTDVDKGHIDVDAYRNVAEQLMDQFGLQKMAITLRESISASDNVWSACLYNGKEFLKSRKYPIHIVDRVGGGDSFSSGLIYALISGKSDAEALEFGTAASCLKQTIHGDFNLVTVAEVEQLTSGKTGGRVQR